MVELSSLPLVTLGIIGLTVYTSRRGFTDEALTDDLIFAPCRVARDDEYHRLFTSGLLHADWTHLLFNMFSLYSFGGVIENEIGVGTLLIVYLSAIIGGGLLSLRIHRHDETYRALGASGGVCGVIFAAIFLLPGIRIEIFPLPFAIPAWLFAILFMVGSFAGMRRGWGRIGHDAHLGGALIGLAATTIIHPRIIGESTVLYAAVLLLALGLYAWSCIHPQPGDGQGTVVRASRRAAPRERRREDETDDDRKELDRLLAKISASGIERLTPSERRRLERIAERTRRRRD